MVVLDDLQWSDETTLELLAALAEPLRQMPVLVVGAYRSDGLPRDHRLRWLRNELRRGGRLRGARAGAARPRRRSPSCWGSCCPRRPPPRSSRTVHDRTMGSPFFVEELVAALRARGALRPGRRGLELAERDEMPVPDTVRDAVLVGISDALGRGARSGRGGGGRRPAVRPRPRRRAAPATPAWPS